MSSQTSQLLDAFDALRAEEKRIFTAEFLRRALPFDSGPLDDEETANAADALFAVLDAEEYDASCHVIIDDVTKPWSTPPIVSVTVLY